MSDYDAIIIGAGHNGLVAANVLAKGGAKVLVLERAHFLGGMAATRELFDGYKHSVGAWAVLIWRQEMTDRLELTKWGFELMDQWTSTCTFGAAEDTPFVMYNDLERMGRHLLEDHGPDVAAGLGGLFAHLGRFAPYFVNSAFGPPLDIIEVIAEQPTPEDRHDFAQIGRHRLPQCENAERQRAHVLFHGVDAPVALDHRCRRLGIATRKRVDRLGELGLGQSAHLRDFLDQPLQLAVEAFDGVVGGLHRGHVRPSFGGRRPGFRNCRLLQICDPIVTIRTVYYQWASAEALFFTRADSLPGTVRTRPQPRSVR